MGKQRVNLEENTQSIGEGSVAKELVKQHSERLEAVQEHASIRS